MECSNHSTYALKFLFTNKMKGDKIVVRQDFGTLKVLSLVKDSPPSSSDKCFYNLMSVQFISD